MRDFFWGQCQGYGPTMITSCLSYVRQRLPHSNIKHFLLGLGGRKFRATQLGRRDHGWDSLEANWKLPFRISFHINWVSLAASQRICSNTHNSAWAMGVDTLHNFSNQRGRLNKWQRQFPLSHPKTWTYLSKLNQRSDLVRLSDLPASGLFFFYEAFVFPPSSVVP